MGMCEYTKSNHVLRSADTNPGVQKTDFIWRSMLQMFPSAIIILFTKRLEKGVLILELYESSGLVVLKVKGGSTHLM